MIRFAIATCTLLSLTGAAAASCAQITDTDERHFCEATTEGHPSQCASISGSDQRHFCNALAYHRPSECSSITESNKRHFCQSAVR